MFLIRPEYSPALVEQFCNEKGLEFTKGTFILRRFEDGNMNGWAMFIINGKKVTVTGVCKSTPVDVDLFIRSGLNAAELRGCEEYDFSWELWAELCDVLLPQGYTHEVQKIEQFFAKSCKK